MRTRKTRLFGHEPSCGLSLRRLRKDTEAALRGRSRPLVSALLPLIAGLALAAAPAFARDLYVYPAKGQSEQQLGKDRYECHSWAVKQTGYDPTRPQQTAPPPQQERSGASVGRGAVGGAVIGGAIGSTSGNFGKGAAIGAVGGGLIGGMRRNRAKRRQAEADRDYYQRQNAQAAGRLAEYNRALGACLNARGYEVR